MFVYFVTALLCLNVAMGRSFRLGNITVIIFSVVWMLLLVPNLVESLVGNTNLDSAEVLREFFGLLITIFTMLFHLRTSNHTES